MEKRQDRRRVTLRLDEPLIAAIEERAADRGITVTTWIALALAAQLRRATTEPVVIREVVL